MKKALSTKSPLSAAGLGFLIGGAIAGIKAWPSVKNGELRTADMLGAVVKQGVVFGGVAAVSTLAGGGGGGGAGIAAMSVMGLGGKSAALPEMLKGVLTETVDDGGAGRGRSSQGRSGTAGSSGSLGGMKKGGSGKRGGTAGNSSGTSGTKSISELLSHAVGNFFEHREHTAKDKHSVASRGKDEQQGANRQRVKRGCAAEQSQQEGSAICAPVKKERVKRTPPKHRNVYLHSARKGIIRRRVAKKAGSLHTVSSAV